MNKKINLEFILGLIILFITIFSFFYFSNKLTFSKYEKNFFLTSSFFDIGSLEIGADVKINGVKIGQVSNIYLDNETYLAIVETSFTEFLKIPKDSLFKISNNGFVGSPYIEIILGSSSKFLENYEETIENIDAVSLEEIINNFIFK
tara:strand:- start:542 stop:982 length:441 start_codon:yes stop_codon:yes gene_type:complete